MKKIICPQCSKDIEKGQPFEVEGRERFHAKCHRRMLNDGWGEVDLEEATPTSATPQKHSLATRRGKDNQSDQWEKAYLFLVNLAEALKKLGEELRKRGLWNIR